MHTTRKSGFALIATLSVMLLIVLLLVAMLSLASTTTRGLADGKAQAEAQANAKLALMLAIGDLQKHTGQDTRVTAPADLLYPNAPAVVGAWRSWEGKNHYINTGRPLAPDYAIKSESNSSDDARFLSWLVSQPETDSGGNFTFLKESPTSDTVPLLAEGSLKSTDTRQIHVVPIESENGGRFAWWVSPENQKARLAQPHQPRTDDAGGWVEMGQSHGVPNPEVFGLGSLLNDRESYMTDSGNPKPASRTFTLANTELIDGGNTEEPHLSFHDLSTSAVGLLTNTATGGWRKDMSILTEKWNNIYASYPGGRLPLFRFSPGQGSTSQVPKPTPNNYDPPQSNLYPWSEYSLILGYKQPSTYHAASASWALLQSFATAYKSFSYDSGLAKSPFIWDKIAKSRESSIASEEIYNYKHKQRLYPQIARFRFIVYAKAEEDVRYPDANPKRYLMNIKYVPVFTLWNPYNVSLEHTLSGTQPQDFLGFGWRRSPPGVMAVVNQFTYPDSDGVPTNQFKLFTPGNFQTLDWPKNYANPYDWQLPANQAKGFSRPWIDKRTFGCYLPEGTLTFQPGEAKIYSPGFVDTTYPWSGVMRLKEGYDPINIEGVEFWNRKHRRNAVAGLFTPSGTRGPLTANQSVWFLMRTDRVTQPYRDREPGSGFSLSFGDGSGHFGGGSMPTGISGEFHNITSLSAQSEGEAYWPPDEVDEVGYTVGELASGPWIPVFSIGFGPRMTIGTASGTAQNRPTKGVLQNNALASMVLSDPASGDAKDHPANNTFDFAYHSLTIGSTLTPNLSDSEGFIATGYQSGDGLSRIIMADIPLRPMASLVELQGWNPRGNNPYPPFQMNLIGNSDATPLIPKNDIVPPEFNPDGVQYNLIFDDAYCSNHLLFDDWFVSSIAPQPRVLGGDIAKDIETFYGDFLKKQDRLSNRSYRSIVADPNMSSSEVASQVQEILNSADGWLKIASLLEVDGMFNVNSTSVEAWKALLGHAKSIEEIGLYGEDSIKSVSPSNGHAITRGAVASDVEAGTAPAVGGQFPNASEYTGFRSLTDDQIEDLAEKIVEQVRLRGPFLSLSEFVNRQLSTNEDLALAGAVQTALNNMDEDPMKDLREPANKLSDTTMWETNPADPKLAGVDYEFSKAAEGDSAYGAPGWIRQADVLRPIAPILSARDDTFTIRAYGDKLDASGKVVARAWCEAVVRRSRNFCDASDPADSVEPPTSPINNAFGRKYEIVSFKWLSPGEV